MTSTFQDTVLDFDLNFLQQLSNNVGSLQCESRLDKQKRAILVAKKKTIATDLLIRKYYDKKEKFEQAEVTLLASKEECKQVCIEYKNSVEKCTQLEKTIQLLQIQNAELEQKYIMSQNQVDAMKSHARQLQVLIKENETATEAMKIDSRLEKKNVKEFEKKISSLQKKYDEILNHLCLARDIAFGKKKLQKHHRLILQKYESNTSEKDTECSMSEDSSDETDFFEDCPTSPHYTVIEICPEVEEKREIDVTINDIACVKQDPIQEIEDHESDYSNGVVSEDTGRGSSLAFSDLEKCVNSPDYFTADSPPEDSTNLKSRKNLIDASTSPRRNHEGVHIATSPLIFDDVALLSDNTITNGDINSKEVEYFITDLPMSDEIVTLKEKRQLIDCATSPIRDVEKVNIATSPVNFIPISEISKVTQCTSENLQIQSDICAKNIIPDQVINSVCGSNNDVRNHVVFEDLSTNCELEISSKSKEKCCLETINSIHLQNENSNDLEVEMILNAMRITEKLITPLPPTPVKLSKRGKHVRIHSEPVQEKCVITENHTTCPDALQLREENKGLRSSIADLTKEILNIKSILKEQLIMPESPKKSAPMSPMSNTEPLKLMNDASQETLTIVCDDNTENISNENEEVHECETLEPSENKTSPVLNVNETLHSDNDQDCTQSPLRCEMMNNNDINNSSENSPHTCEMSSPEPSSPTQTGTQNNTQDNNSSQSKCRMKLNLFGDDSGSAGEDNPIPNCRSDSVDSISRSKSTNGLVGRRKKLSRLDKFRRVLAPQSKIKFNAPPIRKKRTKSKIIPVTKIHPPDPVNSKTAYEKALQVMRELKMKKITKQDHFISRNGKKVEFNNMEVTKPNSKSSESQEDLDEPLCKQQNENKQFAVCLSRLNLDKHRQNIIESNIEMVEQSQCFSQERSKRKRSSIENTDSSLTKNIITTRSKSKRSEQNSPVQYSTCIESPQQLTLDQTDELIKKCDRPEPVRKRLKRVSSDSSDVSCKRVLRSSNVRDMCSGTEQLSDTNTSPSISNNLTKITDIQEKSLNEDQNNSRTNLHPDNGDKTTTEVKDINDTSEDSKDIDPKQSIICKMIEKYGRGTVKFTAKKVSDNITNAICKKLTDDIGTINKLPVDDSKSAINILVKEIQGLNRKHFLSGFMKYLKDPVRKEEMYNKIVSAPAPSMTKSEQVLLYILKELLVSTPDIVNVILTHIEFALFHLNKTPEFDVIESLSHFYALTCRYFRLKTRLRVFLLDAMYCLQFKVIPLIKQCLDVWMHILPLAHMGIAKSPLVTCLVYLLHFYKCEDRLNRIQDIRFILNKKYFYKMTDWNEPKVLEMFKNAIMELREIPLEKKMFRLAFIILAKRHGPKWCQKNIIKNMLTPLIEKEDVPLNTKKFCISLLGPLLKPYPKDMKVHCEIAVNQLLDKLEQNPPDDMKEAIFTSLIYMNKHNQTRVTQALLSWSPKKPSEEFEQLMCDFVREKPVRVWKSILSKIML